jgi:hypothetical protein
MRTVVDYISVTICECGEASARKTGNELELLVPEWPQKPERWRLSTNKAHFAERIDGDCNIVLA